MIESKLELRKFFLKGTFLFQKIKFGSLISTNKCINHAVVISSKTYTTKEISLHLLAHFGPTSHHHSWTISLSAFCHDWET